MTILLDHCVPRKFRRILKEWGYEAHLLTEHIAANSPDTSVVQLAQTLDAVLLTIDLDFANILDYPPGNYAGLMVMRYEPDEEAQLLATLKQVLADLYRDKLRSILVIVQPTRYRIRR